MRATKQKSTETVQVYAERLLCAAEQAWPEEDLNQVIIQRQILDIFIDGLHENQIARKVLRGKKFPFLICNNTNKTIKLNRGNVVARVEEISGDCVPVSATTHPGCTLTGDDDSKTVNMDSIPADYREELEKLLRENEDLFAATDLELGRTEAVTMKTDTGDHPPIRMKPYRTPLNQRDVVENAVDEMLKANIIRPSKSSWSFPILLVPKKDGGKRFCVDFRNLNRITKTYVWPLPHIDDVLASLGKSQVFSSLDLKNSFWQVPADEKDREKVAFTCHKGLYKFNSMPFGLTNAPSVFQVAHDTCTGGYKWTICYRLCR